MKLYKLTDEKGQTKNQTQWGENISHTASVEGQRLCSDQVIHAYESPLVAAFMYPVHVDFKTPILWEAEGEVLVREGQLKCGCKTLTTLKKIPLPEISTKQRIEIAILCSLTLPQSEGYRVWAERWLSGEDRSEAAACAAYSDAADAASRAASRAASYSAFGAAYSAAYAAADAAAADAASFDLVSIIEKVVK